MSEEKKTVELKEEDLEQVNGGVGFAVSEVDVGDVFLYNNYTALIVKSKVVDNGNDPYVPLVIIDFDFHNNTWKRNRDTDGPMSSLNNYTYSQALSGTLNHLLN